MSEQETKIEQELRIFENNTKVHDLPEIFHYWSNKYLKPILEEFGISHPDDLYVNYMLASVDDCKASNPLFVSIGSGNCDTEVRIAKRLKESGLRDFRLECMDLNPVMLARGQQMAEAEGIAEHLIFSEKDVNQWNADGCYTAALANQSLHHIENLEGLFDQVTQALHPAGSFITSDMIGRNGHQRWPEALDAVNTFWQELPQSHKYNHQLQRFEETYENWDCSTEGFEGIRAQDILPLLNQQFHFELFIPYSNVIDIFVDRGFGHNFKVGNSWDTDFIDRVHQYDESAILAGTIKPTHLMAVMKLHPVRNPAYSRGLTPQNCVRRA